MNAELLMQHFEKIIEAPEAVKHLRRFILDLAVRGKLVAQDEKDEPAQDLLEKIKKEKERLVKAGELRKSKLPAPILDEEIPEKYLGTGTFIRLETIAILKRGLTAIQRANKGEYPLVVTAEARASCDHFDFDGQAAIIPMVSSSGHGDASLKRLHYQEGKFALGNILCAVFPILPKVISARFIFEYLSTNKEELLVSRMVGTANVSLTLEKLNEIPIPMVSPRSQAKVSELMNLCDLLEKELKTKKLEQQALLESVLHFALAG